MRGNESSDKEFEETSVDSAPEDVELREGEDYYIENGLFVFTATFLLRRGYCCDSGCRHCPYEEAKPR